LIASHPEYTDLGRIAKARAKEKEKEKEKAKDGLVRFALFTGKIKVFEDNNNNNNNWVEDYDSLLANKGQLMVVKTRDQQIPLAHYRV